MRKAHNQPLPRVVGNYILEKANVMDYRVEDRPALTDVVITPAMIEAGVRTLLLDSHGAEFSREATEVVRDVLDAALSVLSAPR